MILYLDSHLLEDTEFFIRLSTAFTEILQTVRHYAYPAIVYKIVLYNFLHPTAAIVAAPQAVAPKNTPVAPAPVVQASPSVPTTPAPVAVATPIPVSTPLASSGNLMEDLLARIDKDNLKSALRDHTTIESDEPGRIKLTVINKMSQMMIDKAENKATIEAILTQIK